VKFTDYVVDTEGLSAGDRAEVCRLVVRTLEETADQFETDIPWARAASWLTNVRQAADTLVTATGNTHIEEPYQQTGMTQRVDEAVWQAFATFAGYAYDASVWSDNRALPIVSLSDEGTSVVVRLDEAERRLLTAAVDPARVRPLREARAERRRSR
jgi:hypothetical protein